MTELKEGQYYITKYAFQGKVFIATRDSHGVFSRPMSNGWVNKLYLNAGEYHPDWDSAMQEVERMRAKKIASLEKQLQKVKTKTFKQP